MNITTVSRDSMGPNEGLTAQQRDETEHQESNCSDLSFLLQYLEEDYDITNSPTFDRRKLKKPNTIAYVPRSGENKDDLTRYTPYERKFEDLLLANNSDHSTETSSNENSPEIRKSRKTSNKSNKVVLQTPNFEERRKNKSKSCPWVLGRRQKRPGEILKLSLFAKFKNETGHKEKNLIEETENNTLGLLHMDSQKTDELVTKTNNPNNYDLKAFFKFLDESRSNQPGYQENGKENINEGPFKTFYIKELTAFLRRKGVSN